MERRQPVRRRDDDRVGTESCDLVAQRPQSSDDRLEDRRRAIGDLTPRL
jgi:hypothetical protein